MQHNPSEREDGTGENKKTTDKKHVLNAEASMANVSTLNLLGTSAFSWKKRKQDKELQQLFPYASITHLLSRQSMLEALPTDLASFAVGRRLNENS